MSEQFKWLMDAAKEHGVEHLVLGGLTSSGTYIRLTAKESKHLAAAPLVLAASPYSFMMGLKIRSAWDQTYAGRPPKIAPVNEVQSVAMLKTLCPNMTWEKVEPHRLSTILVVKIAASRFDREAFNKSGMTPSRLIDDMFKKIEDAGAVIENRDAVKSTIVDTLEIGLGYYFLEPPEPGVANSEIVNSADPEYVSNVLDFPKKIKEAPETHLTD